jgi:hypothetical protein
MRRTSKVQPVIAANFTGLPSITGANSSLSSFLLVIVNGRDAREMGKFAWHFTVMVDSCILFWTKALSLPAAALNDLILVAR